MMYNARLAGGMVCERELDKLAQNAGQDMLNGKRAEFEALWDSALEMQESGSTVEFLSKKPKLMNVMQTLHDTFYVIEPLAESQRRRCESVHFSCSCPHYQRVGKCKHVLYEGWLTGKVKMETAFQKSKKKKGAPRKTKKSLEKQPPEWESDDENVDTTNIGTARA